MKALKHAFQMVWRNRRSYALLSVTVVLTLSFLLGYLLYTDASIFNRYKDVYRKDRNDIIFWGQGEMDGRLDILLKKTQEKGTVSHYRIRTLSSPIRSLPLEDRTGEFVYSLQCLFIPSNVWKVFDHQWFRSERLEIQWLDGQEHETVNLQGNQMLMERSLYELLGLDRQEKPRYDLFLSSEPDKNTGHQEYWYIQLEVVGVFETDFGNMLRKNGGEDSNGIQNVDGTVYLPMSLLSQIPESIQAVRNNLWYDVYYTDVPEEADKIAGGLNIDSKSTYRLQDEALEATRNANSTKAIIAAALFVILGISLYSCFSNALNDRKFEIGVKRAIGASGGSIIRQFLMESLIVMGADILVSVSLVLNLAVIFKFLTTRIPALAEKFHPWIIYLSPYSMGMFALCALGLTVSFSLIFAYKSTQVQIVDYLKAE